MLIWPKLEPNFQLDEWKDEDMVRFDFSPDIRFLLNDEQFGIPLDEQEHNPHIEIRKEFPEIFLWDSIDDIGLVKNILELHDCVI